MHLYTPTFPLVIHSLTHLLTHLITHLLQHLLTYSNTYSLTYSFTHVTQPVSHSVFDSRKPLYIQNSNNICNFKVTNFPGIHFILHSDFSKKSIYLTTSYFKISIKFKAWALLRYPLDLNHRQCSEQVRTGWNCSGSGWNWSGSDMTLVRIRMELVSGSTSRLLAHNKGSVHSNALQRDAGYAEQNFSDIFGNFGKSDVFYKEFFFWQ